MIKVSVVVLTYKHEPFIRKTLDSILSQKVNFSFEVIVGDDASPDNTAAIIKEYHQKYPNIIVPLLHEKNLGGFGKNNTLVALEVAKGQYIAPMDGDDYWTDDNKLQEMADFLDTNPDYVACFHNAEIIFDDDSHPNQFVNPPDQKEIVSIEDFIGEDEVWFIATSAILFRHGVITNYPKWFHESKSGDIPRYILLGKNGGKFRYINKVMSVYRKNRHSGMSFTDGYADAEFLENRIGMYRGIDEELNRRFHTTLNKNIARYYRMLLDSRQYANTYFKKVFAAIQYLRLAKPSYATKKEIIRDYILPVWLVSTYSFFALLPHRLKKNQ
ncbi:glycosyltransferase [Emticicia sp. TH156]|uniref:glycosyltransferase family 2 protein n=1 Tax=Emticicia sp. TH156 TaxID=2067454 RepID=UPI000C785541|nr:glycosyltransferase [Emticicia sp. TH156]PLK42587.1 glycosyl transferase family 2 [Emticicia sp. TH156]